MMLASTLSGLLLFSIFGERAPWACTVIAVGKDASATGVPMVGHSDDSGPMTTDLRLVRVPRKKWPEGSLRPLYLFQDGYPRVVSSSRAPQYAPVEGQTESKPLAYIPQVSETYAYWDLDYAAQNEVGLSIGESTCTAKTVGWPVGQNQYGHTRAGIEELTKLAMERCATARCAVDLMGKIAVEQGFYSADSGPVEAPAYDGSSECLAIADSSPGELWIFNVMTGKNNASAIWAAQRLPADHVTGIGNAFSIRKLNLSDSENSAYSPGVTELAEEMGWWNPKDEKDPNIFDFFGAYGYQPAEPGLRNVLAYYSGRRLWRIFSLLSPDEGAKLDPNRGNLPLTNDPYPISVRAKKHSVTLEMVLNTYRDHYEGTPYDLTKGMAAGPYGNPNRAAAPAGLPGQWERAISMFRTSWSYVTQSRPNGRSVMWFGLDAQHGTAYLPIYGASTSIAPASYSGHSLRQSKFGKDSAWWAFNAVNQYSGINFQMINKDVREKAKVVESKACAELTRWEDEADKLENTAQMEYLTKKSFEFAEDVVSQWWELLWELFGKYGRLVVTNNESDIGEYVHGPGSQELPEWWLNSPEVGYTSWTPNGPYHGFPLAKGSASELSELADGRSATFLSFTAVFAAVLMPFLSSSIAFAVGYRRGYQACGPNDFHYVAAP